MSCVAIAASVRRLASAGTGRPIALAIAATLLVMLPAADAAAQGTDGRFPSPRAGREIDRWLDDAGVPGDRRDAAFEVHARYLGEVERLRDGEIEAWVRTAPRMWSAVELEDAQAAVAEAIARIDQQRRLLARLDALEERMWNEIAAEAAIAPGAAAALRQRGRLARLGDFAGMTPFMHARPADLATLLAAVQASPAEAARIREALADHDAALAKILEERRDLALDAERRRAERQRDALELSQETQRLVEEEIAAANAENREAQVQAIYDAAKASRALFVDSGETGGNRLGARVLRLQLAAVRAIEPVVTDPRRLAKVLVAAGVGADGSEEFFEMFEEMGRRGELSPAKIERVAAIRQRMFAENLPQRLAIAELHARRLELADAGWRERPDGSFGPSPEQEEIDAKMQELEGGDRRQREMQLVVELGQAVGSKAFGEAMRAWGRKSGVPEPVVEQIVAQLVAGIDAGAIDAEEMQKGMMQSLWSAPPAWRIIDSETLGTIFDDLQVAAEMRLVATQLIQDGTPRFEAAIAATAEELAPKEELDPESMGMAMFAGLDRTRIDAIDAGLRRVLAADDAFFDDLVGLLGEESAPAVAPWRALRRSQMIAAASDGSGGMMRWAAMSMGIPSTALGTLDLFPIAVRAIPEAMADPAVRAAFAAQAERIAQRHEARWASLRSLLPERHALMNAQAKGELGGSPESIARLVAIEAALQGHQREMADAIRGDLVRMQSSLDPESARTFRRAALLTAWGDQLGDGSGREAIAAARGRAESAGDAARVAAIEASAARYDAGTDASLDLLWRTSEELLSAASLQGSGEGSFEGMGVWAWWTSAMDRAIFRQAELDFATTRMLRSP